jgi:hypothetical protein
MVILDQRQKPLSKPTNKIEASKQMESSATKRGGRRRELPERL